MTRIRIGYGQDIYAHIRNNPKFDELVTKRRRFAMVLSAIVPTMFYGFIMQVAFSRGYCEAYW